VLSKISSKTGIKFQLGESGQTITGGHILVTVPGFLKQKLVDSRKANLDLTALKLVVYDEADELFIQESNLVCFQALQKYLKQHNVTP